MRTRTGGSGTESQTYCSTLPLGSALHAISMVHSNEYCCNSSKKVPTLRFGRKAAGRRSAAVPALELVLLFTGFLAAALARQRFLDALLLARLEVEGVTLHFLNNVLLLNLAFEAA